MAAADLALVRCHSADVVGMLLDEVCVQVVERLAHLLGVLLVDAEDDRLGEAVGPAEEVGEVLGDGVGTRAQGDFAFEVLRVVLVVGDLPPVAVALALSRPPARGVHFGDDSMNAVGGEEPVVDALAQAVGVDGVPEVVVGVAVLFAQRSRRHAELVGGLEVVEDLPPVAVVACAAAMALVDDDEVEEVARVLAVESRPRLVFGDGLVDGEVHLAALHDRAALDLEPSVPERR